MGSKNLITVKNALGFKFAPLGSLRAKKFETRTPFRAGPLVQKLKQIVGVGQEKIFYVAFGNAELAIRKISLADNSAIRFCLFLKAT